MVQAPNEGGGKAGFVESGVPMTPGPDLFAGRYRLLNKLGEGGMGAVFLAQDVVLDRRIALKIPHAHLCADEGVITRFLREARMAAQMENHPNFCRIYDVSQADGRYFLTMDYVEGTPLSKLVGATNPWPTPLAVDLVRQLALALQALHAQGIIHRDLKPSNVMIRTDGLPVLMDFGLARPLARIETTTNQPVGTPAYMSPEQVKGDRAELGPAADIYALGVMLFQLITGQVPYRGPLHLVFAMILDQPPPPPSSLRPGVDSWLDRLCVQAMAKEPLERPGSMAEFAALLQQYLQHAGSVAAEPTHVPAPATDRKPPASRTPAPAVDLDHSLMPLPAAAESRKPPLADPTLLGPRQPTPVPDPTLLAPSPPPAPTRVASVSGGNHSVATWLAPPMDAPSEASPPVPRPEPATPPPPVTATIVDPPPGLHGLGRQAAPGPPSTVHPLPPRELLPRPITIVPDQADGVTLNTIAAGPASATPPPPSQPRIDRLVLPRRGPNLLAGLAGFLCVAGFLGLAYYLIRPGTTGDTSPTSATASVRDPAPPPEWTTAPRTAVTLAPGSSTVLIVGVTFQGNPDDLAVDAYAVDATVPVVARPRLIASLGPDVPGGNEVTLESGRPDIWGLDAIPVAIHVGEGVRPGRYSLRLLARARDASSREAELIVVVKGETIPASFDEPRAAIRMVRIPAGFYRMGSQQATETDAQPAHPVILPRPFYLSACEVSERQHRQGLGQPLVGAGDLPQRNLTFADATAFCERLRGKWVFRLPTEAEWEYACRAGTDNHPHHWPTLTSAQAVFGQDNTAAVGSKEANRWRLHDMHGNVREWCADWYSANYYAQCVQRQLREAPSGPEAGPGRVARGGCYADPVTECTSFRRFRVDAPENRSAYIGIRLLAEAP